MSWRGLVTGTLGLAAVAIVGILAATPRTSYAQVQTECGQNSGNLCRKKCNTYCNVPQVCCDESYFYYPKNEE